MQGTADVFSAARYGRHLVIGHYYDTMYESRQANKAKTFSPVRSVCPLLLFSYGNFFAPCHPRSIAIFCHVFMWESACFGQGRDENPRLRRRTQQTRALSDATTIATLLLLLFPPYHIMASCARIKKARIHHVPKKKRGGVVFEGVL